MNTSGPGVDFGAAAGDYARHRRGFPPLLFELLAGFGIGRPGQQALEVGTGTGSLARGLAGAGARVVGLDPSAPLMAEARALDREQGIATAYVRARAERTPFRAASFHLVAAGQCWHWFDGPAAAAECRRLLRPGGRVLIAHFDYLARPDNAAGLSETILLRYHPQWPMAGADGIYDRWRPHLTGAGFGGLQSLYREVEVEYSPEAWRGRMRACNGVLAIPEPERRAAFDAELARELARAFPGARLVVPHRVFALWGER
ncbi:MAG: class I SAM-dependent methyltransferase [Planctomycetes bacterium]|nr:class I SAM-dependent methyltransferase [Planctomycetota bacterium]